MNLGPRRVLGCAFLLAALASPRAEAAELTFNLVAEEDWLAGRTEPDRFIPGQVLLYPVGSYQPWRVVETGRPALVPLRASEKRLERVSPFGHVGGGHRRDGRDHPRPVQVLR